MAIATLTLAFAALLLAGCTAPIGADRVTARQAYDQVDANALRTGKPSSSTMAVLHRHNLGLLAERKADEAVRELHKKALATGDRELLFAMSELSYVAANQIRRSVKPWDTREARDFYLGSAVYAYLYLFGEGTDAPSAYQRQFRQACDFYNYSLGLALIPAKSTNVVVSLESGRRRLPVGEIECNLSRTNLGEHLEKFHKFLLADQFRVRGLSVRNRDAGLGAPLIGVGPVIPNWNIHQCAPVTVFLRGPASLKEAASGQASCALELFSSLDEPHVAIGAQQVPIETDLTTYRAYTLNQSFVWQLGMMGFLNPAKSVESQLILSQPYTPGRIPVVFVHGTFSSPVTWAEMVNTLTADPVLRSHYQLWSFVYSSGNPLAISATALRDALTATVQKLDPEGKDPALRQMVIIGHSQGGLLTKMTATDTGDRLWNGFTTNRLEDMKVTDAERAQLRRLLFLEPLPFVSRVVFICTPHRGSYLSGSFARRWAYRLMALPGAVVSKSKEMVQLSEGTDMAKFFQGRIPTSLDSMSPKNPLLITMADIPVAPTIKAHSIVAVQGKGDYHKGKDGVVAYTSAHVDYVESEFIVRGPHSCLNMSTAGEEVRRILREHVDQLPAGTLRRNTSGAAGTAGKKE